MRMRSSPKRCGHRKGTGRFPIRAATAFAPKTAARKTLRRPAFFRQSVRQANTGCASRPGQVAQRCSIVTCRPVFGQQASAPSLLLARQARKHDDRRFSRRRSPSNGRRANDDRTAAAARRPVVVLTGQRGCSCFNRWLLVGRKQSQSDGQPCRRGENLIRSINFTTCRSGPT